MRYIDEPTVASVLRMQELIPVMRQAMIDLIAKAPLSDFETLKEVFLTHCTNAR